MIKRVGRGIGIIFFLLGLKNGIINYVAVSPCSLLAPRIMLRSVEFVGFPTGVKNHVCEGECA